MEQLNDTSKTFKDWQTLFLPFYLASAVNRIERKVEEKLFYSFALCSEIRERERKMNINFKFSNISITFAYRK